MTLEQIKQKYSEPHRFYHTWDHIEYMLKLAFNNIDNNSFLYYMIIFHDVIYDPQRKDNEEISVEYMLRKTKDIPTINNFVKEVISYAIIATKNHILDYSILEKFDMQVHHSNSVTLTVENLMDLDLASLAKPWEEYCIDVDNIRKEYSHLTDQEWKEGRKKWIESMLKRNSIFYTEWGKLIEGKARKNLELNLKELSL